MPNKQQHVVPNNNGGWDVEKAGALKATVHTDTKAEAIEIAKEIAKNQNAELIIHNKDGKIGQKNSYGNDPFPPRG